MSFKATTQIELYEQVWKTPMVHLAKSYKCSPAELRNICVSHDVPLPKAGYWTQVQTGKVIAKPKLPFRDRYKEIIEIAETVVTQSESTKEASSNQAKERPAEECLKDTARVSAQTELTNPHPLVKKTLQDLERYKIKIAKFKKSKGGWSTLSQEDWPPHEDKGRYYFSPSNGALPITASLGMIVPILLLVDPLLKALEDEKFKIHIQTDESNKYRNQMILERDDEKLTFWVTEGYSWHTPEIKKKSSESSIYSSKVALANGNLNFHIEGLMGGRKKTFTSGKRKTLEDQIDDIFETLCNFPKNQKELREKREREHAEFERRVAIDRHNRAIVNSQREQLDIALKEASTYREHKALEDYLQIVERASLQLNESEQELSGLWIKVVRHYLAQMDPIERRIKRFKTIRENPDSFYSEHWFKESIENDEVDDDDDDDDDYFEE